jgi:hypothetical protein
VSGGSAARRRPTWGGQVASDAPQGGSEGTYSLDLVRGHRAHVEEHPSVGRKQGQGLGYLVSSYEFVLAMSS